jgi:hypothetical protein
LKPKLGQWGDAKEKAGEEAGTPTYSDKCREERKGKSFKRTFPFHISPVFFPWVVLETRIKYFHPLVDHTRSIK